MAVSLGTDPRTLPNIPAKLKLFFHSDIESRYAEVFLNIDLPERLVQFHEKDQEYRKNVIRVLIESA